MILYTDIDPFCCEVLRARVADGGLLPGEVWERDVRTLTAEELAPFTQIHLFAGIGASPLGLKWAGWPNEWPIITGGFPCQQVSSAGKGEGIGTEENPTERSGLYWEAVRIIRIKRPLGLLIENVGALSARGLDRVVGALEPMGYIVHALRLGAWAVGAPHGRERWWIVAHLCGAGCGAGCGAEGDEKGARGGRDQPAGGDQPGVELADANGGGRHGRSRESVGRTVGRTVGRDAIAGTSPCGQLADVRAGGLRTERVGGAWSQPDQPDQTGQRASCGLAQGEPAGEGLEGHGLDAGQPQEPQLRYASPRRFPHVLWVDENGDPVATPQYGWEPPRLYTRGMAGLADGIPARLASALNKCGVAATGNAQVPQCVEAVGRGLIAAIRGEGAGR